MLLSLLSHDLGAVADLRFGESPGEVLAELLLDLRGATLLSGAGEAVRALRSRLLLTLPQNQLNALARHHSAFAKTDELPARGELTERLAAAKWTEGGAWARAFVTALELPPVLAGARPPKPAPTTLLVEPHRPPPPLKPFQAGLRDRLLEVLRGDGPYHRAIVTLPTGGGKTRTAGEALCALIDEQLVGGAYFLWIAQSEELCDQATACLRQLWAARPYAQPLPITRYYGGRELPPEAPDSGLVVASIQQLAARLEAPGAFERALFAGVRAIVIDEAHRATSRSYLRLFETIAAVNPRGQRVPIGGLTATPGRSGGETGDLVQAFGGQLLRPELEGYDAAEPLEYFRTHGFLARPDHESVATAYSVQAQAPSGYRAHSRAAIVAYEAKLGRELARADRRNDVILRRLVQLPAGTPTLVYACTTEHVKLLHLLLRQAGRTSAYLLGDTRRSERARIIAAFRRGEVDFLVNYGVLTTGFDAPRTACVAITRPITSEVLYEQIVGRGLRGAAFGGTERCLILDFEDNFRSFGDQLAYHRFARFWDSAKRVELSSAPAAQAPAFARAPRRRRRQVKSEGPGLFG